MTKKMRVTITSAMGEEKYALTPAQLLRLTDFAARLQTEQGAASAQPEELTRAEEELSPAQGQGMLDPAAARVQVKSKEPADRDLREGPYKGFLLIRCEECRHVAGYFARRPMYGSRCRRCGTETPLEDLRIVHLHCSCGTDMEHKTNVRYKTNIKAEAFTYSCLNCGRPVRLRLNWRGDTYVTEQKERE